MYYNKKAFTLSEIIVSVFISSIILSFLFFFLNDSLSSVSLSKSKSQIIWEFNDFNIKLNDLKINYSSWSVISNNTLILRNTLNTKGVMVWIVDLEDYKITSDFNTYWKTFLWYRELSDTELSLINSNVSTINNLSFQKDKIFQNIHLKSIKINSFNSWSIFEIELNINPFFQQDNVWENWSSLDTKDLFKLNIIL